MTAALMIHLPATLAGFGHWLATHWPTAPRGCQWQYGGRAGHPLTWAWRMFCRHAQ